MLWQEILRQWYQIADLIYLISLIGYKMAILLIYLRLFAINSRFKYLTWTVMFFVCGYLFSNFWTQIFGCSPPSKYWHPDIPGHCINYTKAGLAYGSMNISSDFFIFLLPLPMIWGLKLSRKEKIGVSLIFMSGAMYVDYGHNTKDLNKILNLFPVLAPWQSYDIITWLQGMQLMPDTLYGGKLPTLTFLHLWLTLI